MMKGRMGALGMGWVLALGSVHAAAEITIRCEPSHAVITNQPTVTVDCTIISTMDVNLKSVQLDFPCDVPAESEVQGYVRWNTGSVDREQLDPPFLFGPAGIAAINPPPGPCRIGVTAGIGSGGFVTLRANSLRYLGSVEYDVATCEGEFRFMLENWHNPPIAPDVTRVTEYLTPLTQRLLPFAHESVLLTVEGANGRTCDDGLFCTSEAACTNGVCVGSGNACPRQGCDEELNMCVPAVCPNTTRFTTNPPSGVVDARQPHPPQDNSPLALQGIGQGGTTVIMALSVANADEGCFTLCEPPPVVMPGDNDIADVFEDAPGLYLLSLVRPISPGAVTTISYGEDRFAAFASHPGNANGDDQADADDMLSLIAYLDGDLVAPYGMFSMDIDHSGGLNPFDLMRMGDLLNGADLYAAWNGTPAPTNGECP